MAKHQTSPAQAKNPAKTAAVPPPQKRAVATVQGLDLSGLDEALGGMASLDAVPQGKPLSLPLDKVIEDPNQPRKKFDPDTLQELADSISVHGVKSPISVKSPDEDGNYRLNFGARRRRAALMAGLTEIPGFIDDDHDRYAQVVENIQRDGFTPMELARFLADEMAKGEKAASIAKRLGQNKTWVSKYNSLNELPDYIQARSDKGDISDYNTLYEIGLAVKKDPEKVAGFIESKSGQITRADFKEYMRPAPTPENAVAASSEKATSTEPGEGAKPAAEPTEPGGELPAERTDAAKPKATPPDRTSIGGGGRQERETGSGGSGSSEPTEKVIPISSPVLMVRVKGKGGLLRLDIAGEEGFGFVEFEGEGEPAHTVLADVEIVGLISKD